MIYGTHVVYKLPIQMTQGHRNNDFPIEKFTENHNVCAYLDVKSGSGTKYNVKAKQEER